MKDIPMTENNLESQPAVIGGVASRVSAADKAALQSGGVVMTAAIHVTRAATGKVETYQITGTVPKEQ